LGWLVTMGRLGRTGKVLKNVRPDPVPLRFCVRVESIPRTSIAPTYGAAPRCKGHAGVWSGASGASPAPAGAHAQLGDPGYTCDGYHHAAADGGNQHGHPQRDGATHTQKVHVDLR